MKHSTLQDSFFLAPGFLVYGVFMVVPLLMSFFYSFTNWDGISPSYKIVGLKNFVNVFQDAEFYNALKVTLIITLITALIYNVLGILLAAVLDGGGFVSSFSKSAIFVPTILSSVVVAFIWSYMVQTDGGVINTLLQFLGFDNVDFYATPMRTILMISVIIAWNGLGLFLIIYVAALNTIPQEIYEAAKVDGANWKARFFKITLPLLMPGITVNSILSVAGGLKQYDHVKVITGGGPGGATQTVTLYAVEKAFEYNRRGYSSAIVLILFLLIVVLSVLQLRVSKKYEVEY